MLSVIIPTLNAEQTLPATLSSLFTALIEGMISEVIIADGGSSDKTGEIAETTGANFVSVGAPSRGLQQKVGAQAARADWLLFLHADTCLEEGWHEEAKTFIKNAIASTTSPPYAAFRFTLDDKGLRPALLTGLVQLRCALLHLPYGDQGLLIERKLYEEVGGHADLPIMEDVDLLRRLPGHPARLKASAVTSAGRFKKDGYFKRSIRNLYCLGAFYRGTPAEKIRKIYDPAS